MAKLFYERDHGSILVKADDDTSRQGNEIEVTPEQATAVALSRAASMLGSIADALFEIEAQIPAISRDKDK
jgi:hypothetical protein